MRNFLFFIVFIPLFHISCTEKPGKIGSCYYRSEQKIFFLFRNVTGSIDSIELIGADAAHFQIIYDEIPGKEPHNGNIWAKDKTSVWFKNVLLKGADPETFKVLENGYAKDKQYVYFNSEQLQHVNPKEFIVQGWFFAKTNSGIWYFGKPLTGIEDIPSFKVYDAYFSFDKNAVYFNQDTCFVKLIKSDPSSFKCITNDKAFRANGLKWYKDNFRVYCIDTEVDPDNKDFLLFFNVSVRSFEILSEKFFSKDETNIYYKNAVIENADLSTFKTLGKDYSRDKYSVFYKTTKLTHVDVESFKIVNDSENLDASDSKNQYIHGNIIK
jgi:hypothetical protein